MGKAKAKLGPLVSVLVPTYNGARYLDEALRSARRQTYRNLEVLIRDDGSQDATIEIARAHCAQDHRFVLCADDGRRLGGTGNMVELLRRASGEFVKYLHQDDLLEPTCVERLVHPLRFDPLLTMATSPRHLIDSAGCPVPAAHAAYRPLRATNAKLPGADVVRHMVTTLTNQLGEPSVALFRNGVVTPERAFVLDGVTYSYLNDMALWTNLLLAGDLHWHATPLSSFRAHGDQRSAQLSESITVVGELACYTRFGVTHGFVRGDAAILGVVRGLSGSLAQLHANVADEPATKQPALSNHLAEAVARLRALLEVRQDQFASVAVQ